MACSKLKRLNVPNIIVIPMLVIFLFSLQYSYSPETSPLKDQYEADVHVNMRRTALENNFDTYLKSKPEHGSLRKNILGQDILPSQIQNKGRNSAKGI